jgi:hypothetical protein
LFLTSNSIYVNSILFTEGGSNFKTDVSVNSRLFVYGDVSMNQRLTVSGDVSLNGNVVVSKDVLILGRLSVQQYSNQNIINKTNTNY